MDRLDQRRLRTTLDMLEMDITHFKEVFECHKNLQKSPQPVDGEHRHGIHALSVHGPDITMISSKKRRRPGTTPGMSHARLITTRRLKTSPGKRLKSLDAEEHFNTTLAVISLDAPLDSTRAALILMNGLLSIGCAALIRRIEEPAQIKRLKERDEFLESIDAMRDCIMEKISHLGTDEFNSSEVIGLIKNYSQFVPEITNYPEEITWDMKGARAFIASVQTTTGYGDIVPSTTFGKVFTILYGVIGIPIFMWCIFKLGGIFRLYVMKVVYYAMMLCCPAEIEEEDLRVDPDLGNNLPRRGIQYDIDNSDSRRWSSVSRENLLRMNRVLKKQFDEDKRFHPIIIALILLLFLLLVALFVSHMESMKYFDSFYASFITYSGIGFGDMDIFEVSYRSNWVNLIFFGNFVHVMGYMVYSAWLAALLEKIGVRKF